MPILAPKPLRTVIAGLGLFAGVSSAQAALTITFEEDTHNGLLSVIFSGESISPLPVVYPLNTTLTAFDDLIGLGVLVGSASDTKYYSFYNSFKLQGTLPWSGKYESIVSATGAGGFIFYASYLQLFSNTYADTGDILEWDGSLTYIGTLAEIGLSAGDSGTLIFTADGETPFSIDWVVAIPEPTTHALLLGAGVCGVALLRRRSRR